MGPRWTGHRIRSDPRNAGFLRKFARGTTGLDDKHGGEQQSDTKDKGGCRFHFTTFSSFNQAVVVTLKPAACILARPGLSANESMLAIPSPNG